MIEKTHHLKICIVDLAFLLQIEKHIRLKSQILHLTKSKELKLVFSISGSYGGQWRSCVRDLKILRSELLPDGDPTYRLLLDQFCKFWEKELKNCQAKNLEFFIRLIDDENDHHEIFYIEEKEVIS